jgi:hypothetical protein
LKPHEKHQFELELGWLHCDGFYNMVKKVWAKPVTHTPSALKKWKFRLASIIDHHLERTAKVRPLYVQETELKIHSGAQLARFLREEELKWYQRSKF